MRHQTIDVIDLSEIVLKSGVLFRFVFENELIFHCYGCDRTRITYLKFDWLFGGFGAIEEEAVVPCWVAVADSDTGDRTDALARDTTVGWGCSTWI